MTKITINPHNQSRPGNQRLDSKVSSNHHRMNAQSDIRPYGNTRLVASNHILHIPNHIQGDDECKITVSFLVHLVNTVYLLFILPVQNNKDTVGHDPQGISDPQNIRHLANFCIFNAFSQLIEVTDRPCDHE
jgi:hypothetical protein